MAISQVITFGGSPDQLVWKYQNESITATSQLVVDETHEALLVVNGNAADLFGPGTRTLSLPNIPIAGEMFKKATGGTDPFPCKIFYINKVHQLDLMWGTQGAIAVEDPDYQIFLHVMLHGTVAISVGDSRKFMLKLVGFRQGFNPDDVVKNFRGLISAHVKDCISKIMINGRIGFFQMNANLMEVSGVVQERLTQIFEEYGIIIHFFNIESIEVPDKDYEAVKAAKERRASRIIEGYTWQEEKQMDIAKTFAGNEGTMGGVGGMMGGMMGGAMMGGTIAELARSVMSGDRIPTQTPPPDMRSVSSSGTVAGVLNVRNMMQGGAAAAPAQTQPANPMGGFDVDSNFGAAAPAPSPAPAAPAGGKFCPNCGNPVGANMRFCSNCGTPLARSCPNCGGAVEQNDKFCPNCGQKL